MTAATMITAVRSP